MTVNNVLCSSDKINNLSISGCLLPIKVDVETGADQKLTACCAYSKERNEVLDLTAPYLRMHGTIFI